MTLNDMMDAGITIQGKTRIEEWLGEDTGYATLFEGRWEEFTPTGDDTWMSYDVAYIHPDIHPHSTVIELERNFLAA